MASHSHLSGLNSPIITYFHVDTTKERSDRRPVSTLRGRMIGKRESKEFFSSENADLRLGGRTQGTEGWGSLTYG